MVAMFTNKQIWALLVPLMIEQLLNSLMGTADTIMVTTAGAKAISAVALVDSINVLVILVFAATATGGSILCSQYIGNNQYDKARHTGKQLILSVTVISVAGALLCILFRLPLLTVIFGRIEEDVMKNAQLYFFISVLSYPFIALYNAASALFRADKNSKLPMKISTVSNLLNIAGNAIFIFGFNMSVLGAALATLISRVFCAVTILFFLNTTRQEIRITNLFNIKPDFSSIKSILKIGVPTGIENGMFQFGKLAIQSTVSTLGTAAIAANAMTAILESFSCQATIGIGLGMMTIVGQCIGCGNKDMAVKYIKKLTLYGFIALLISSALVCVFVKPITVLSRMEADVALLTVHLAVFIHIIKPFAWTWSFLPAYGMKAAGDVKFSMTVACITMWTCRVAVTIVLIRIFGFGPIAVWIGMATDWCIRSVIFFIRFINRKWLNHALIS